MTFENDAGAPEPPLFLEVRPGMRRRIERAVESLVALLDEIDGDADLEEEPELEDGFDQEQELGATGCVNQEKAWRADASGTGTLEYEGDAVAECDRENTVGNFDNVWSGYGPGVIPDDYEDDDPAEHGGDDEPTLGATTAINQDCAWRVKNTWSLPCDESEPSLGWTGQGRGHPQAAMNGYDRDLEENTSGPTTMNNEPTRLANLSLPALIVRTYRVKAARLLFRAANAIMTLAERVLPEDMRRG